MSTPGLLRWSNNTVFTMVTDPGRQNFHDQIQTHGYEFLDSYLQNIAMGPREAQLIELVKTPARNKTSPQKKIRTQSKLNKALTFDDEEDKENASPARVAFVKTKSDPQGNLPVTPLTKRPEPITLESSPFLDVSTIRAAPLAAAAKPQPEDKFVQIPEQDASDLSAIVEGDEPVERRASTSQIVFQESIQQDGSSQHSKLASSPGPNRTGSATQAEPEQPQMPAVPSMPSPATFHTTETLSAEESFHSVEMDSPTADSAPQKAPSPAPTFEQTQDEHHNEEADMVMTVEDTQPAEIAPISTVEVVTSATVSPMPQATYSHMAPALEPPMPEIPTEQEPASEPEPLQAVAEVVDDTHTSLFPTLPDPQPLRKSVHASMVPQVLAQASVPAPPVNNRTSWLQKMREVKGFDNTTKRLPIGGGENLPGAPAQSVKRKSMDMLGTDEDIDEKEDRRIRKPSKNSKEDVAPVKAAQDTVPVKIVEETQPNVKIAADVEWQEALPESDINMDDTQGGMLDRLRKTVEGLGARSGKSASKSLGGAAAANALAKARAAAEAKVAERDQDRKSRPNSLAGEEPVAHQSSTSSLPQDDISPAPIETRSTVIQHTNLRMSDLFQRTTKDEVQNAPTKSKRAVEELPLRNEPVFKPQPVFHPPSPQAKTVDTLPKERQYSPPSLKSTNVGLQPRIFSPPAFPRPNGGLSAQSTVESMASDQVFESQGKPAWMSSTQDTEYSFTAQDKSRHEDIDADESIVDDPLPEGVRFSLGYNNRDDDLTWSTNPTESQKLDRLTGLEKSTSQRLDHSTSQRLDKSTYQEPPSKQENIKGKERMEQSVSELAPMPTSKTLSNIPQAHVYDEESMEEFEREELLESGMPTIALVDSSRSQSQISMASTSSSQSTQPRGFFGQASKLMSSVLGSNKKDKSKPEVKSLQLAAAAQKKEHEERERAAARKAQMEDRRQQAIQRKAEEERGKALAEEKKMKEETERRKRERDETTEKRLPMVKKKEEEPVKKRKLNTEAGKAAGTTFKPGAVKNPPGFSSQPSSSKLPKPQSALPKSASKSKLGPKSQMPSDDDAQPAQMLHSQMAARAQAQLLAAGKASTPPVRSENIELPDIASEYSDSEDEDRPPKAFVPPDWAEADNLRRALEDQSRINPDSVFGAIKPLRMEEIFKETASKSFRMRNRTSSANWSGADRLTVEEETEYARKMGYVNHVSKPPQQ